MPAYSTVDLIYEVYVAIASMESLQFSLDQLVQKINENRVKNGERTKVSSSSVDRILRKLWLPLGIRKTISGNWEKGTGPIRGMANVQPEVVERIIKDQKIDATPAEIEEWIGLAEEPTTHKAYICYPYHDNPLKRSIELLILLILLYPKARNRFVPATPHEMYWGLEERTDRETAMIKCEELIEKCDFMLYCLRKKDKPSAGMKRDVDVAKAEKKEILYIEDLLGTYPNVSEIMIRCGLAEFAEIPKTAIAIH
jgi:hypothetical protein